MLAINEKAEEATETPSWEAIRFGIAKLCEERGWHHGCPMPSSTSPDHRLVVARRSPLGGDGKASFGFGDSRHVCSSSDVDEDAVLPVNSWTTPARETFLYRERGKVQKVQSRTVPGHERLKFWLDSMTVRLGAVDAGAEFKAMLSLRRKLSDDQWESYILSGMFWEVSPRSRVTYILRKGMPTIALTERPREDGRVQRHFLAALCAHPVAYYVGTWVGSQPPSDDVLSHLMLIRGDEHRLWRVCNQHGIDDPAAGI